MLRHINYINKELCCLIQIKVCLLCLEKQLKIRRSITRVKIHVCSFHFILNITERGSIDVERLQKDNNNNTNNNSSSNLKLNQSFQNKSIFTSSKVKELLKENNIKIFKNKIYKIKSKNNFAFPKGKQFVSSNLVVNKNNINKTKLDISLKRVNYNLLKNKNKKVNYIVLYDDNTSNEEISKPRSKQGSPRLNYKNVMCCSTKKFSKIIQMIIIQII